MSFNDRMTNDTITLHEIHGFLVAVEVENEIPVQRNDDLCQPLQLNSPFGTFGSPVVDGVYPNNIDCSWTLRIPSSEGNVSRPVGK